MTYAFAGVTSTNKIIPHCTTSQTKPAKLQVGELFQLGQLLMQWVHRLTTRAFADYNHDDKVVWRNLSRRIQQQETPLHSGANTSWSSSMGDCTLIILDIV